VAEASGPSVEHLVSASDAVARRRACRRFGPGSRRARSRRTGAMLCCARCSPCRPRAFLPRGQRGPQHRWGTLLERPTDLLGATARDLHDRRAVRVPPRPLAGEHRDGRTVRLGAPAAPSRWPTGSSARSAGQLPPRSSRMTDGCAMRARGARRRAALCRATACRRRSHPGSRCCERRLARFLPQGPLLDRAACSGHPRRDGATQKALAHGVAGVRPCRSPRPA